ncbi:MAG: site-2 protease family protein [Candidatus Micrarchaeaceae archaeon]
MQSPKIGKIFGVDIELHWLSILFLLLFLFISLYLFLLMLLLLVSVLLHELAHSVTSIRNKIKVSKIILILPIGGLSVLDKININPKIEFNIAVAGPIMSIFIGSAFGVLVPFTPPGIITQIFQFMFEINILLGVLNLLPAFPTDGGRVFRSYLERKHNFYDATMLTVKTSKAIMYALVIGALAYVLIISSSFYYKETLFVITLFTVFILYGGAEAEQNNAILRKNARGLSVKSAATKDFVLANPNASIKELYNAVKRSKKHMVITHMQGAYAYVNLFDKRRLGTARYVADLSIPILNIPENTNVVDAISLLENKEASIAAVTKGGKLIGIVTEQHLEAFVSLHVAQKSNRQKQAKQ